MDIYAYVVSETLVQVLEQCDNDLSRENIVRRAANLQDLELSLVLPGVRIDTSQTDYRPMNPMRSIRFNGRSWSCLAS